jgi:hypothetical protein
MRAYLKGLAMALAVINLLFWLWSNGSLRVFGWGPVDAREPQRLEEQLRPEVVRLIEP